MTSSMNPFLNLPLEIRHLIYNHVFTGAQITISPEAQPPPHPPRTHIYRNAAFHTSLLHVNKQLHTESFPVLVTNTTLLILPGTHDPNHAVSTIPDPYLAHIPIVLNNARIRSPTIHVLRQQHLDLTPFANLQVYRVAHLVCPDWRDASFGPHDVERFIQSHLETDFFFQAGTLRLFTQARTYALTVTMWLLKAFVEESLGWEAEFSLDTWTVQRKRRARFRRRKNVVVSLCEDPKCRDYRNYNVEFLDEASTSPS